MAAAPASAGEVKLTGDNTKITFVGSKKDGKHEGGFKTLAGTAKWTDGDPTSLKLDIEIDAASIHTDNEKLTEHLKSPDFFGVKDHPKAKFVSTKVAKAGGGLEITGDLTVCGKTKAVTFPATLSDKGGFKLTAEFKIDRHEHGVGTTFPKEKIDLEVPLKVIVEAK